MRLLLGGEWPIAAGVTVISEGAKAPSLIFKALVRRFLLFCIKYGLLNEDNAMLRTCWREVFG